MGAPLKDKKHISFMDYSDENVREAYSEPAASSPSCAASGKTRSLSGVFCDYGIFAFTEDYANAPDVKFLHFILAFLQKLCYYKPSDEYNTGTCKEGVQ